MTTNPLDRQQLTITVGKRRPFRFTRAAVVDALSQRGGTDFLEDHEIDDALEREVIWKMARRMYGDDAQIHTDNGTGMQYFAYSCGLHSIGLGPGVPGVSIPQEATDLARAWFEHDVLGITPEEASE